MTDPRSFIGRARPELPTPALVLDRDAMRANVAAMAAWSREHAAFHAALVSACGSRTLISIRERLFAQAERYVSLSIMSNAPLRDDVGEHKQLMRAALNRDVDKAIELNRLHISRTTDKVAASLAASRSADTGAAIKRKSFK